MTVIHAQARFAERQREALRPVEDPAERQELEARALRLVREIRVWDKRIGRLEEQLAEGVYVRGPRRGVPYDPRDEQQKREWLGRMRGRVGPLHAELNRVAHRLGMAEQFSEPTPPEAS